MKIGLGLSISFSFLALQACEPQSIKRFPAALTIKFIGADYDKSQIVDTVLFSAETLESIYPSQKGVALPTDYQEREIRVELAEAYRKGFPFTLRNAIGQTLWNIHKVSDFEAQNWFSEEESSSYEEIIEKEKNFFDELPKSHSMPRIPTIKKKKVPQVPKKNDFVRAVKTAKSNNIGTKAAKRTGKKVHLGKEKMHSGKTRIIKTFAKQNLDEEWRRG